MEWERLRGEGVMCSGNSVKHSTPATLGVETTATGDGGQAGPSLLSETRTCQDGVPLEGCLALSGVRSAHILRDTSLAVVSIHMHAHAHTHTYSTLGWAEAPAFKEQALGKNLRWLEFLSSELRRGKTGEPPTEGMAGKG